MYVVGNKEAWKEICCFLPGNKRDSSNAGGLDQSTWRKALIAGAVEWKNCNCSNKRQRKWRRRKIGSCQASSHCILTERSNTCRCLASFIFSDLFFYGVCGEATVAWVPFVFFAVRILFPRKPATAAKDLRNCLSSLPLIPTPFHPEKERGRGSDNKNTKSELECVSLPPPPFRFLRQKKFWN